MHWNTHYITVVFLQQYRQAAWQNNNGGHRQPRIDTVHAWWSGKVRDSSEKRFKVKTKHITWPKKKNVTAWHPAAARFTTGAPRCAEILYQKRTRVQITASFHFILAFKNKKKKSPSKKSSDVKRRWLPGRSARKKALLFRHLQWTSPAFMVCRNLQYLSFYSNSFKGKREEKQPTQC